MARSSAHRNSRQNPHNGKDKLAGGTLPKDSDRRAPTPTATYAPTPVVVPVVALLATSGSAYSSVIRYLEDDFQQILRTVLDSRPPTSVAANVVAVVPHSEGLCERLLKARFPDIY